MADRYEYSEKVKTPKFRGAFVQLVEPKVEDDGNKKYGVTAIFTSDTDIGALKAAAKEVAKKCWGDKADDRIKHPKFKSPFRDGGTMLNRDGEAYTGFEAGQVVVKMTTKTRPGLVDTQARAIQDADGTTVVDRGTGACERIEENAIYSGAYFWATVVAQAYDRDDGFGISFKLENVQLLAPGERLGGGRSKPEDDFAPVGGGSTEGKSSASVFD